MYPFGNGLSYTNFNYGNLILSSKTLKGNQTLTVSISITNTGSVKGKEVVQLYIRDIVGSITRPLMELKEFQKIELKENETKTVSFNITPEDLKFYNSNFKYDWESGDFEIMIGTSSKDIKSAIVNRIK